MRAVTSNKSNRSPGLLVAIMAVPLLAAAASTPASAAVPGANGPIAFVSDRDSPAGGPVNDEIYVTDETGSQTRRVTNNSAPTDQFPAVSPNGKEIAFFSNRNDADYPNPEGDLEIYVMDINDDDADGNGDNLRRLTNDARSDTQLAWSPDGRKLAFQSARDGDNDVYMMDAEGSEPPINLTTIPDEPANRSDAQPAFSPDGSRIAFSSFRDGNLDVYLMNADGTGQLRITSHPAVDAKPEFSPDGATLAFMSARDGNLDIYVMSAQPESALNPPHNLTNSIAPLQNRYPSWSPDRTKIAFWPGTGNGLQPDAEIVVMNADGSDPTNLTNNHFGDIQPSWGPARVKKAEGQAN